MIARTLALLSLCLLVIVGALIGLPFFGPISTQAPQSGLHGTAGSTIGFANSDRLDEHYEKHAREFGPISKLDYLRQAQSLRDAPRGGPILDAVRRDGVITRFDRRTGAFLAANPNGVIRTFFKPNDGERYFRRQAERD